MAIQGGGGPKGPRFPTRPAALEPPASSEVQATPAAPLPVVEDGFEESTLRAVPALTTVEGRVDEALAQAPERPSGVRNMARVLEQTQVRLAEEHQALRGEAQATLRELAAAGFGPEAVAHAKSTLDGLRARMAKQRRRLSDVRRRLRLAYLEAGAAGELALQGRLKANLDSVARMPAGLDKRLAALQLAAQTLPRHVDGTRPPALRHPVKRANDSQALGEALTRVAPEAAASQAVAALLGWPGAADATKATSPEELPGALGDVAVFSRVMLSSAS